MKKQHINHSSVDSIHDAVDKALKAKREYQVSISVLDTSLRARQRALCCIWYKQIDESMGSTAGYSEAMCKLHWGLKIACQENEGLQSIIDRMLHGHNYDQKLEIIQRYPEWFPILRDKGGLDADGQARYLNCIQVNMADQGIILSSPRERDLLNCSAANR